MTLPKLGGSTQTSPGAFVSKLFESRTQAHIYHLQTTSFAAHKALNEFYDAIGGFADSIVENYQGGKGQIIRGYSAGTVNESTDPTPYFKSLLSFIETNRYKVFCSDCSDMQNIVDEIVSLVKSTIYKLTFLK